jgi:hypothetical protein
MIAALNRQPDLTTITSRGPTGIRGGADFVMPTMC